MPWHVQVVPGSVALLMSRRKIRPKSKSGHRVAGRSLRVPAVHVHNTRVPTVLPAAGADVLGCQAGRKDDLLCLEDAAPACSRILCAGGYIGLRLGGRVGEATTELTARAAQGSAGQGRAAQRREVTLSETDRETELPVSGGQSSHCRWMRLHVRQAAIKSKVRPWVEQPRED